MVDAFVGFTYLHPLLDLPKRSCMHFAPLCALHYSPCGISYVTPSCIMFCRVLEVNARDMHIAKLPPRLAKPTLQLLLSKRCMRPLLNALRAMSTTAKPYTLSITAIVAATAENGIGLNGGLPWRLPGEMKYFARGMTYFASYYCWRILIK